MTDIVMCFDSVVAEARPRVTNVQALWRLLDDAGGTRSWYHPGVPVSLRLRRHSARVTAETAVADAYCFITERWQPGDRIFVFGSGHGAYCARSLCRLLDAVGVLPQCCAYLQEYALATYALPRRARTAQEWRRLRRLAAALSGRDGAGRDGVGRDGAAVPVQFLGLWDTVRVPGLPRSATVEPPPNVGAARHAVAIDGAVFAELLRSAGDHIEEVWFRGDHYDVTGGPGGCPALADITFDWVLDGALRAGLSVRPATRWLAPAPADGDAVAGTSHPVSLRRLPPDPEVHASVQVYLRCHPQYWRRLPARFDWVDLDWLARSERLVPGAVADLDAVRAGSAAPVLAYSAG